MACDSLACMFSCYFYWQRNKPVELLMGRRLDTVINAFRRFVAAAAIVELQNLSLA